MRMHGLTLFVFFALVIMCFCPGCVTEEVGGGNVPAGGQPEFSVTRIVPRAADFPKIMKVGGRDTIVPYYRFNVEVTGRILTPGWEQHTAMLGERIETRSSTGPLKMDEKPRIRAIQYITPVFRRAGGSGKSEFHYRNIEFELAASLVKGVEFRVGKPATEDENELRNCWKAFTPVPLNASVGGGR